MIQGTIHLQPRLTEWSVMVDELATIWQVFVVSTVVTAIVVCHANVIVLLYLFRRIPTAYWLSFQCLKVVFWASTIRNDDHLDSIEIQEP